MADITGTFKRALGRDKTLKSTAMGSVGRGWFNNKLLCAEEVYVETQIKNLFEKILRKVFKNIKGLDEQIEESFFTFYENSKRYYGLTEVLLHQLIIAGITTIGVRITEDERVYYDFLGVGKKDEEKGTFTINSEGLPIAQLELLYHLQYNVLKTSSHNLQLSQKPFLKLAYFRDNANIINANNYVENVEKALADMKQDDGFMLGDKDDTLDIVQIDSKNTLELESMINRSLANALDLPLSVFSGAVGGDLNSSGEWDLETTQDTLEAFYKRYIKPVLSQVEKILMVKQPHEYRRSEQANIEKVLELIGMLDPSTFLTPQDRSALFKEVLMPSIGIDAFKKNK